MTRLALILIGWWALSSAALAAGPLDEVSHRDKFYDLTTHGAEIFAVGYPGLVFRSADRGATWSQIDPGTDDVLYSIRFNAKGQGIIVGRSGLVLTTANGGKTWTRAMSGVEAHLFAVDLTDDGHAWAVGHFGMIIHSADAGKTWEEQSYDATLPPPPEGEEDSPTAKALSTAEEENEGAVEEARLNGIAMTDAQTGWIVGEFGLLLRTEDGGQTWKRQRGTSGMLLFAIHAMDGQHALVVGSEATSMETSDGGQTWQDAKLGKDVHLLDIHVADGRIAAAGREGVVAFRDLAGGEVDQHHTGQYAWLNAIVMLDAKTGFAAGGRGHLLKTEDGGANWTRLAGR